MMSEPPKRCGFSKEWVARRRARSRGRRAAARPWWCPRRGPGRGVDRRPRTSGSPSRSTYGRRSRHRRVEPRRRLGQPHRPRSRCAGCRGGGCGSGPRPGCDQLGAAGQAEAAAKVALLRRQRREQKRRPPRTSTRHSRHLPCLKQEVGTVTPSGLGALEQGLAERRWARARRRSSPSRRRLPAGRRPRSRRGGSLRHGGGGGQGGPARRFARGGRAPAFCSAIRRLNSSTALAASAA